MKPLVDVVSFLGIKQSYKPLPEAVMDAVQQVTVYDTQYTLQVEDVNPESDVYRLRLERNQEAARMAMTWLQTISRMLSLYPMARCRNWALFIGWRATESPNGYL
jgi:hypothetical protein